ncbi:MULTISPECIES: RNA-binding protein [Haloferax]|uniref:PUA domain protein n=6 Tax=Haloferax TaxID=2251 RepID=D4H016_HALVD|nr:MULTISPECIES: RNA-binding protein [Haloferax]ADE02338.1 PUA domain protein [Haloferax volcanii DS2]ELK54975.1 RNA-binding protein [Haloferax sp. BAB-2207]ELY25043.1 RNA-binding protein [Haloferax volcanii DS2]ELZ70749.1 RNA-binding protein [Haloferax lucentense DSM 14919]ELZ90524.1 RNA-binding protein [Haloferax alexandrinus JCM 10717]
MKVKSRHHLRSDEIDALCDSIESSLGVALAGDAFEAVEFADADYEVVLVDGEPAVMYVDDQPFLTVKGANQFPPTTNVVTVDAGAVSFVSSGADVMRPGITEADESIEAGDLVVIAEETHGKVLAVGRALEDGADLVGDSGKVVESIHHVGDDLFEFSV